MKPYERRLQFETARDYRRLVRRKIDTPWLTACLHAIRGDMRRDPDPRRLPARCVAIAVIRAELRRRGIVKGATHAKTEA
jgi:hypothetical protein